MNSYWYHLYNQRNCAQNVTQTKQCSKCSKFFKYISVEALRRPILRPNQPSFYWHFAYIENSLLWFTWSSSTFPLDISPGYSFDIPQDNSPESGLWTFSGDHLSSIKIGCIGLILAM